MIEPRTSREYRSEIIEREPEPEPRLISEREGMIETAGQSMPHKKVREDLLVLIRRRIMVEMQWVG